MLIKSEHKRTNNKSVYQCDRCKVECINTRSRTNCIRIGILRAVSGTTTWTKKYDLCRKCYASFERGIQNYSKRIELEN